MAVTRRTAAASEPPAQSQPGQYPPQQQPEPVRSTRGRRKHTAPAVQSVAKRRKLRSGKDSQSPGSPPPKLASPQKTTRRIRQKTTKSAQPSRSEPTPAPRSEDDSGDESGAGIFFKDHTRKLSDFLTPQQELKKVRADALQVNLENVDLLKNNELLQERVVELEAEVLELRALETELKTLRELMFPTGQVETDMYAIDPDTIEEPQNAQSFVQSPVVESVAYPPVPDSVVPLPVPESVVQMPVLEGSPAALELLHMIESHATSAPATAKVSIHSRGEGHKSSPKTPEVADPATPLASTPKQGNFFNWSISRVWGSATSLFASTPPPPALLPVSPATNSRNRLPSSSINDSTMTLTPTSNVVNNELAMTLTPTPTPIGERRDRHKKRSKQHRQAVIQTVVNSVNDPAERAKAEQWATNVLSTLSASPSSLGEKRKRLEGGVKLGDLKRIQGTKPWTTGSYGLDDSIADLSDDEDAPAWAVLQDMVLEERENPPTAKRRKSRHAAGMDTNDIASLNDTTASSLNESDASTVIDTNGNSASLRDLRPRSSIMPSPMFDSPTTHQQGSNVFNEVDGHSPDQPSSADRRAAFKRELRRTGHVTGSGSWCVPEGSSDEEDSDGDSVTEELPWTQEPPPAPVPAHASLPTLGESNGDNKVLDPIDVQRAKITKHTPAKPSRLRETFFPSPSLISDAGNESLVAGSLVQIVPQATEHVYDFSDMPDAQPLDVSPEYLAEVEAYTTTDQFQADVANMGWDDPIFTYSEDETSSD